MLLAFGVGFGLSRGRLLPGSLRRPPAGIRRSFSPFWEAWNLTNKHHVRSREIGDDRMTRGAIQGLLDSLGDSGHTTYLSPDQLKKLMTSLDGLQDDLGASIVMRDDQPTIADVVDSSPARLAGLRPGDVILAVDGEKATHLSLGQLIERLSGPMGETVAMRLRRQEREIEVKVTRGVYEPPIVIWAQVPGESIAMVHVRNFSKRADEQLRAALHEVNQQGLRGVILDLRGNPGGFRDQAVAVASEFLAKKTVLLEMDSHGRSKAIAAKPGGQAYQLAVVVLVDEGTASAAEIVASALQDNGRATLIGQRTYGTGTVLQSFALSDGSAVLIAVAKWLRPTGASVWHKGIVPDVDVPQPTGALTLRPARLRELDASSFKASSDVQVRKAVDLLHARIENDSPQSTAE
jgi:carboxyl-terminal processing protease